MNKIVNKVLLVGDKFMPEMHVRQPEFTYSACGPFTKSKERIKIYQTKNNVKPKFSRRITQTNY